METKSVIEKTFHCWYCQKPKPLVDRVPMRGNRPKCKGCVSRTKLPGTSK